VQTGLSRLAEAMKDFEADRRKWTAMDRTVKAAREVNLAVGARNKAVVRLYDSVVAAALSRFDRRLKEAPEVYRRLADDERRKNLAASTLELERRSYLAMAEMCESAAVLCERRHEEIFGDGTGDGDVAPRPQRRNALALAETIDNMRKLSLVHDRWEETFAAHPSSLDDGKLAPLFDHLAAYAEDLEGFTKGVEALKDVMKKKAREKPPEVRNAEPKKKPENPPPAPAEVSAAATPAKTTPVEARVTAPRTVAYLAYRTPDGRLVYFETR
jgi:hypothetical protein